MKKLIENIFGSSKCNPKKVESDDGKELVEKNSTDFSTSKNIRRHSRYTSRGATFVGYIDRTLYIFLKQAASEKGSANHTVEKTKHYFSTKIFSTKLEPIQASFKKDETYVYKNNFYT